MSSDGARQFARYAYPPNELGYCGPEGADALLDPDAVVDIARRARLFDGAWVYLEILAEELGSADPLSVEVVEAYWLGTDLLDSVDPARLVDRLSTRFGDQHGGTWRSAAGRALAHHSFQVFEVYPWAAMLQAGLAPGPAVSVLDRCRIRCGTVQDVEGEWVTVTSRLLHWDGAHLAPGAPGTERARWAVGGRTLLAAPEVGDLVALHWDWVCDVLTPAQADQVERREAAQLTAIGLSAPSGG